MMTQKLGNGFEFIKKACFVCRSLNRLIKDCNFHDNKMVEKHVLNNKGRVTGQREIRPVWNNAQRVNHQNKLTHPHPKRNFVPIVVATKSGQVPVNDAKQNSSRAARSISTVRPVNTVAPKSKVNDALPKTYSYFKAHSPIKRAFNQKSEAKTNNLNEKVKTTRVNNVTTAGPKAVVSAAVGNGENAVKSSACWIWRPTGNVIDHTSKDNGSYMFKRFDYVDLQGRLKHMTGNKSFLTDYQEVDGGFIAFAASPKGGKITGKGKIRTGKLDFEDVYFIKELKFNLFSVSQMCDNVKYRVLFTETDVNVVPLGGLTCLFAKAIIDESNLWHRRLGHINFKTMNKLVKGNLVRGSGPEWLFDIDSLTKSMNYELVTIGNQTNDDAGIEANDNTGQARQEKAVDHEYILLPFLTSDSLSTQSSDDKDADEVPGKGDEGVNKVSGSDDQERTDSSTQDINIAWPKTGIFDGAYDDEDVDAEADLNNLETTNVLFPQPEFTKKMLWSATLASREEQITKIIRTTYLPVFSLKNPSWIEAMQEDLLQFKLQNVWTLVDLLKGKRAIGTKIEAIRLFLAYASFMGLIVYQMDVKSAFLYGTIKEEVYVCQPPGFEDPQFPDKVYKVEKALYGLHQAPRAWYETLSTYLLENGYRRGTIDKTLFIKKDRGDILLVQVYVDDIIFGSTKKSLCVEFEQMMHKRFQMSSIGELTFFLGLQATSTPIETNKALNKDEEAEDVDVHLYRSIIGSLMYLTASRPDIMFVVYACARFQVTPKTSHLHAVKRIFRYLKGQPKLGLWYTRDSPFDLEAFFDSDYAGASLDRKSTTGGVMDSNQMLDYGFNFMNTKIHIDNESTICIVKNPVFHSKTKHIEIRHRFIRDSYEKELIQVIKIHIDQNFADLLTNAFDVSRPIHLLADEIVYKEWEDKMERAATTASSFKAEQDNGNINRTQSMATLNESLP
ncbi:putative ribonuclease H-like domain-containing protein [Tanacetum coccineum]